MTAPAEPQSGSPTKSAPRGSPRSSLDSGAGTGAGAGAHAPFLQTLQQRFRKSSNASGHSSDQAPPRPDTKSRSEASKEAKRYLLSVIRDDWEYPSTSLRTPRTPVQREVVVYRRREDGLSDAESDRSPHKQRSRNDPYKFENPDSVAHYVSQRRAMRRRLVEEEMSWNLALRNWSLQRDAWTGAVKNKPNDKRSATGTSEARSSKSHLSSTLHERNISDSATDESINWPLSPNSPTPRDTSEHSSSIDSGESAPTRPSSNTHALPVPTTHPHPRAKTQTLPSGLPPSLQHPSPPRNQEAADSDDDGEPYLPIYPPLFPSTHILRSRITVSAYPTIYSKIVVQSLTPNIPIPLVHMTRALVDGWKAEGAWPPNTSQNVAGLAGTAADRRDGQKGPKKSESAFTKWRREHSRTNYLKVHDREVRLQSEERERRDSTRVSSLDAHDSLDTGPRPVSSDRAGGKVRKSITKVKRALGVGDEHDKGPGLFDNHPPPHHHHHADADIGIDFEEHDIESQNALQPPPPPPPSTLLLPPESRPDQQGRKVSRDEVAGQRDRMLNVGLLDGIAQRHRTGSRGST